MIYDTLSCIIHHALSCFTFHFEPSLGDVNNPEFFLILNDISDSFVSKGYGKDERWTGGNSQRVN